MVFDRTVNDLTELIFGNHEVDLEIKLVGFIAFDKMQILRNRLIEDESAEGCFNNGALFGAVLKRFGASDANRRMKSELADGVCHHGFVEIAENFAFAGFAVLKKRQIIRTKHHILRRNGNGMAVDRLQQVIGREHKETGFALCFGGKRNMNRHLVAVEVGVERCTNERMQLDSASLDENRLESLNRQSVKRRCAVKQHRMVFDNDFECVPNFGAYAFDALFRVLDIGGLTGLDKTFHDKRLEKLKSHFFRQTALIDL